MRVPLVILICLCALASGVSAQATPRPYQQGRFGVRDGFVGDRSGFAFCRLAFASVRYEALGQGWRTDYPTSDKNFMFRMEELTTIGMSKRLSGEFAYSVMQATDPDLFRCPFLFAEDVGTMGLSEPEVAGLREYLQKGGFLWVDDFWGDAAWKQWSDQIGRVLPGATIVDLTPEHPIFHLLYRVKKLPQVPSINYWNMSGGGTSERGSESETPDLRAIVGDGGRILVLMSHDTDISEGWERDGVDPQFFFLYSSESYAIAANVVVWVLTH